MKQNAFLITKWNYSNHTEARENYFLLLSRCPSSIKAREEARDKGKIRSVYLFIYAEKQKQQQHNERIQQFSLKRAIPVAIPTAHSLKIIAKCSSRRKKSLLQFDNAAKNCQLQIISITGSLILEICYVSLNLISTIGLDYASQAVCVCRRTAKNKHTHNLRTNES